MTILASVALHTGARPSAREPVPWKPPTRPPHSFTATMPSPSTSTTQLRQGDGNRFISPFSISTALAMTYAGAQDDTALQMAKALHFNLPPAQLHPTFHHLIAELHEPDFRLARIDRRPTSSSSRPMLSGPRPARAILADFQKRIEVNYRGGVYPGRLPPRARRGAANHQRLGRGTDPGQDQGSAQTQRTSSPHTVLVSDQCDLFQGPLVDSHFATEHTRTRTISTCRTGELVRVDHDEADRSIPLSRRRRHFRPSSCLTRGIRWRW